MKIIQKIYYIFAALIAVYIGVCGGLYLTQNKFLYKPNTNKPSFVDGQKQLSTITEVTFKTESGAEIYAWYTRPRNAKKAVVFFHGNRYNIGAFVDRIIPFAKAGYAVLMPEYEGYGSIPGNISQQTMEQDAIASIAFLNLQGYENKNIFIYGRSLGSYMAVYSAVTLGGQQRFAGVILESPFTSILDVADRATYYALPISMILKDYYDSESIIGKINTKIFVGHGKADPTVPYELGQKLFNRANGNKTFFTSDSADHQTLPEHGFLDAAIKWMK